MAKLVGDKGAYKGNLRGSPRAFGGLMEGISVEAMNQVSSDWDMFYESFNRRIDTIAEAELLGMTENGVNSPTGTPAMLGSRESGYLDMFPGTKDDAGSTIQFNKATTISGGNTTETLAPQTIGPLVSTTTLMDNRSIVCTTRVKFQPEAAVTTDGAKYLWGWCVDDTAPIATGTDVITLDTGGGIGFFLDASGDLQAFYQAVTADTPIMEDTGVDITVIAASQTWYGLGFRVDWIDASAGTGLMTWYVDDEDAGTGWTKVHSVTGSGTSTGLPMQSTETYSITYTVINGAAGKGADGFFISDLFTAITKPGRLA